MSQLTARQHLGCPSFFGPRVADISWNRAPGRERQEAFLTARRGFRRLCGASLDPVQEPEQGKKGSVVSFISMQNCFSSLCRCALQAGKSTAVVAAFTGAMFAQQSIVGEVKDAASGEPLASVSIRVTGQTTPMDKNHPLGAGRPVHAHRLTPGGLRLVHCKAGLRRRERRGLASSAPAHSSGHTAEILDGRPIEC